MSILLRPAGQRHLRGQLSSHVRLHMAMSAPLLGSCLCGAVAFEVHGPVHLLSHCHCSMCRKFSGAAFLTFARASRGLFVWTRGEDKVRKYDSSPGAVRCFCDNCGSSLPVTRTDLINVLIPAGTLDSDPMIRPAFHMFVADRAPWFEISDRLPRMDSWPTESNIETLELPRSEPG